MEEGSVAFEGWEIQAILKNHKFQFRRIVNPQPQFFPSTAGGTWGWCSGKPTPPYKVGDRLWVKEAWQSWSVNHCEYDDNHKCNDHCHQKYVAYQATPRVGYRPEPDKARIRYLDESSPLAWNKRLLGPWRPSIHMPRWASRITLEVTRVRMERLSDMTTSDALREGIDQVGEQGGGNLWRDYSGKTIGCRDPLWSFRSLWESINGSGSWRANPWVWVYEFKREGDGASTAPA